MGLDNGFVLKNRKTNEEKDIVYWRKHYDYRRVVFDNIPHSSDVYNFNITIDEIDSIIKELTPFLKKKYWIENSDTIFDFNPKALKDDIKNLKKAKKLMKKFPNNYTLEFYDSY